jgi:hypothetical protein
MYGLASAAAVMLLVLDGTGQFRMRLTVASNAHYLLLI